MRFEKHSRVMPSAFAASVLDAKVSPHSVISFAAFVFPIGPFLPSPTVSSVPLRLSILVIAVGDMPSASAAALNDG